MPNSHLHATNFFPTDGATTEWDFRFDGVSPDDHSGTRPYLNEADVKVQELYTDENGTAVVVQRDRTLTMPNRVLVIGAPIAAGRQVKIYRETENRFPLVDYRDRTVVGEADLDLQARQTLFVAAEAYDLSTLASLSAASAEDVAGEANVTANEALTVAQEARTTAQAANVTAGQADARSAAAQLAAEGAVTLATEAKADAEAVRVRADEAADSASAAAASAAQASTDAADAVATANAVDGKATSALANSQAAISAADTALSTANAIDGKATTALADAATALDTANEAKDTADGVDAKAQTALDNAAIAVSDAAQAVATADAATDALNVLRKQTVFNPAGTAAVDLDTLGSTDTLAGVYDALLGGVAGSRPNGHPDGQTAITADNGVVDFYWVETLRFTDSRFQIAYPRQTGAPNANVRIKHRAFSGGVWSAWTSEGEVMADLAKAYADQRDTELRDEMLERFDPKQITYLSPCSHSMSFMIHRGNLYCASGSAAVLLNIGNGRGGEGINLNYGLQNWQRVGLPTMAAVKKVISNGASTWVLTEDGELYVCGRNEYGQLGLGTTVHAGSFVLSAVGVLDIYGDYTNNSHAYTETRMFLRNATHIQAVGYNTNGGLGDGTTTHRSTWTNVWDIVVQGLPTRVWNLGNRYGSAWIQVGGALWVTGWNGHGQLGDGTVTTATSWKDVTANWGGSAKVLAIKELRGLYGYATSDPPAVSSNTTTFMWTGDEIWVVGANAHGQAANGNLVRVAVPTQIVLPGVPRQFFTGGLSCWIVCEDNRAYGWSYNAAGNLGVGDAAAGTSIREVPLGGHVDRILGEGFDRVYYGYSHAVVFQTRVGGVSDGQIQYMAVGTNGYGARGDGSTTASNTATRVQLPFRDKSGAVLEVEHFGYINGSYSATGADGLVVVTKEGSMYAWGHNGGNVLIMGANNRDVVVPTSLATPWLRGDM